MQITTCILLLLILWLPLSLAMTNQTKPGCPTKCGSLTVPYPFGIGLGSKCSIGPPFDINCNTSFNPPKAFLGRDYLEIIDITDNEILIKNRVASSCYDEFGAIISRSEAWLNLNNTPFSFLSSDNLFTVVGCDDFSIITGGIMLKSTINSGCLSLCSHRVDLHNGSCFGMGCCQLSVPMGLKYFAISMDSFHNHTTVRSLNRCGYSFLGEKNGYKFLTLDLSNPSFTDKVLETVPLALDWVIGNQTCNEVIKSNFACQENTSCEDSDTGLGGYRCRCLNGYAGNPYLKPGCQDIDECKNDKNPCHQFALCANFPGGYSCTCPKGYIGDGRKDTGLGCYPDSSDRPLVIAVVVSSIGLVLLLLVSFWLHKKWHKHKCRRKFFERNGGLLLQQQLTAKEGLVGKTRLFSAKALSKATDEFNQSRILGQGGQGTVYKGMLSEGRTVAVKKSKLVIKINWSSL